MKNLSYSNKMVIFICINVVVLISMYSMGIKKTIDLYSLYKANEYSVAKISKAPHDVTFYKNEINNIEARLGISIDSKFSFQKHILLTLNNYCVGNNTLISEYKETHRFKNENLLIETHPITIQGNFQDLLRLLYEYETSENPGIIKSVLLEVEKDRRTKKELLFMTLYLQHISKEKL